MAIAIAPRSVLIDRVSSGPITSTAWVLAAAGLTALTAQIAVPIPGSPVPVTGQTLPLISMGGTSLVFTFIALGIILSVSRNSLEGEYEKA